MNTRPFAAEKISQTASFIIDENITLVFPLFDAFEERKWEPSWNPKLIYPETEVIEVGTTFSIDGDNKEPSCLWRVIQFDPASYFIQYFVSTRHRDWTISVKCESEAENTQTKVSVTYTFIGLTPEGNELNRTHINQMYQQDLQDWKQAIDNYLFAS
ncbi:hypothetical protein SAMN04488029_3632 [Reichenbachiella faecimaris]|uniref:Activator of Hsp90 ATPase homolog 1-like protein n=2 Tax=Reichenbachiella faecimaris TaxID=692418 RepID=A0A1W2GNC8_REIFA|nr:hypothetical protein SAMN04488029_3632 [Reichenbachiella faecimaris]